MEFPYEGTLLPSHGIIVTVCSFRILSKIWDTMSRKVNKIDTAVDFPHHVWDVVGHSVPWITH